MCVSCVAPASLITFDSKRSHQKQLFQSLISYLARHKQVASLSMSYDLALLEIVDFPSCPNLLSLEVRGRYTCSFLQLSPFDGHADVLASCTGLTLLVLDSSVLQVDAAADRRVMSGRCSFAWHHRPRIPPTTSLAGISVLGQLRDLRLSGVCQRDPVDMLRYSEAVFPGSILVCLPQLTSLDLHKVWVQDMHHVSSLSKLAVLSLLNVLGPRERPHVLWNDPNPALLDISPSFSDYLHRSAVVSEQSLGPGVVVGPVMMSPVTQLTRLVLDHSVLQGQDDMTAGASLLAALRCLQQLQVLELRNLRVAWPAPSAVFSALTASPALTALSLMNVRLPESVWPHVFPPGLCVHGMKHFAVYEDYGLFFMCLCLLMLSCA